MRLEPRFESKEDREREAETLRILLEGKDLTFEQLDRYQDLYGIENYYST
jgi:hypothetical protein